MAHLDATHAHRAELRGTVALIAVATLLGVAFGLSTLITPLYVIYQQQFGFSQITLTLVYAAYVIGNITALLFFGRVSDHIGRRLVMLLGLGASLIGTLLFAVAPNVLWLFAGRALTGIGVGLTAGSSTAALVDFSAAGQSERAASVTVCFSLSNSSALSHSSGT